MLSDADVERYARQIVLPEIGGRGQERLLASRVQVLGDGPASLHAADLLRRAGVQPSDTTPNAIVDLRLDALPSTAAADAPLVIGRMQATCATVDALPAGARIASHAGSERAPAAADPALQACALRALGALAASEALVLLLHPGRSARRTTLDFASGQCASQALTGAA
jgi:adenylyltransferase/sulfurtransferase